MPEITSAAPGSPVANVHPAPPEADAPPAVAAPALAPARDFRALQDSIVADRAWELPSASALMISGLRDINQQVFSPAAWQARNIQAHAAKRPVTAALCNIARGISYATLPYNLVFDRLAPWLAGQLAQAGSKVGLAVGCPERGTHLGAWVGDAVTVAALATNVGLKSAMAVDLLVFTAPLCGAYLAVCLLQMGASCALSQLAAAQQPVAASEDEAQAQARPRRPRAPAERHLIRAPLSFEFTPPAAPQDGAERHLRRAPLSGTLPAAAS